VIFKVRFSYETFAMYKVVVPTFVVCSPSSYDALCEN